MTGLSMKVLQVILFLQHPKNVNHLGFEYEMLLVNTDDFRIFINLKNKDAV